MLFISMVWRRIPSSLPGGTHVGTPISHGYADPDRVTAISEKSGLWQISISSSGMEKSSS